MFSQNGTNQKIVKSRNQTGQALVEYALTILMVVIAFTAVELQIRRNLGQLWNSLARDIAAGCPGCEAPEGLQ